MFYEAIYKLTDEVATDLAALQTAWKNEHDGYYARQWNTIYLTDEYAEHVINYTDMRDAREFAERLGDWGKGCFQAHAGYAQSANQWQWLTSGGNLSLYEIDETAQTVRVLLKGHRHGLRMPPESIQRAKPLQVVKYNSWRKDASPFACGLTAHPEIDGWPITKKIRWLVANTGARAVELWNDTNAAQKLFAESFSK